MLDLFSRAGCGVAVRATKNMGNFFVRSLAKGALGVGLVIPVEELVSNPNASSRELPSPSLEAQGWPLDSLGARSPIDIVRGVDWSVMIAFPVTVDPGLEESLIILLPVKGRLLQTLQRYGPGFMKKFRGAKWDRVVASARGSEEILGFRVNQIIHPTPPINILQTLFSLMTPYPSPMYVNRERSNCVVNHLEVVKAGLRH